MTIRATDPHPPGTERVQTLSHIIYYYQRSFLQLDKLDRAVDGETSINLIGKRTA